MEHSYKKRVKSRLENILGTKIQNSNFGILEPIKSPFHTKRLDEAEGLKSRPPFYPIDFAA